MPSLNKVQIIGNLGRDPEVRYSPEGAAIANMSLATTSQWKDKETRGKQERTEWHRVVFYGRLAEIAREYTHKGSLVYVEGSLHTRKWQDKDGHDRYTTEIIGSLLTTLDKKGDDATGERAAGSGQQEHEGCQEGFQDGKGRQHAPSGRALVIAPLPCRKARGLGATTSA
jgi:single-strand DNA-binding protein